ncbi:molybdenum cofactor cytidylyltransferase [Chloroflexota bacterium]
MSNPMISAIILAAGESKRMGEPKLLLPFGSSTILEQSIDNLLNSGVGEVIAVVGDRAQEMIKRIAHRPVKVALNPDYGEGMSTSIASGLSLVDNSAVAIMLVLADQPLIDSDTINTLIKAFFNNTKGIVIPTYQERRGHPIIFSTIYREELTGLKGDVGGKQIIKQHPDDILEIAVKTQSINIDIDTMENYHSAIN